MKRITYFCACLIAVCSAFPVFAQMKLEKQLTRKQEIRARISHNQADNTVDYSLLNQMITKKKTSVPMSFPALMPSWQRSPILTAVKTEIWGCYLEGDYGRMVSFTPSATINFTTLKEKLDFDVTFNGGSALIGNKYYGMKVSEMAGFKMMDLYEYNTDTWQLATEEPEMIFKKSLLATETAKDPASTKVFGQFFTEDLKALEWGFIDYAEKKRTAIKACTYRYVALGYGKDGFAYGVATDGNLYKIDTNNGSETLVGATGVNVMTPNKQYYEQSGEIDPTSGEFYWAATDANMASKLYTVDLTTGAATEVGALPNSIVGMAIPAAEATEAAPDKAKNVAYEFVDGALSGKIKFTAATMTYGGNPLPATNLSYVIYSNDDKVAEGSIMPGANAEANVTVAKDGMYNFKIVLINAEGEGAKYMENHWIGHDEMAAPKNLTMTRNGNGNSHIKLSWAAPTEALHGGYVGKITYNVYRIHNGELTKISEKQSALTFEEDLPISEFSNYYYAVQTVNGDVKGEYENTKDFFFGKVYEPNYQETFDTEASSNPYIKINRIAGSYNPWEWDADEQHMKCGSSLNGKSDSWLISPPIHLKKGYSYFVKYDVITPAGFEEKMEVKWGLEANNNESLLTKELMPVTSYLDKTNTVTSYEKEITADADGNYNFGFHSVSEAGSYFIAIDNFRVENGPLPTAPDSVTNVKGETEPSGLDQALITFTAPTKNRKGEIITTLDKVVVMCGERTVATISPVVPGQVCNVQDLTAQHGENTYSIFAYNADGIGQKTVLTIKVGQDKPGSIAYVTAMDELNAVKLSWDAPKAAEGGVLNPAGIWYTIYEVRSASEIEEIGQTEKGVTEFTIEDFKTYEGKQYIAYWAVTSKNASGSGDMRVKSMLVGKPYLMPHHRSFVNGSDEGLFMTAVPTENNESWTPLRGVSSDSDNGCLCFNPAQTGSSMVMLGKISLRGAVKPQIIFDYKCAPNAKRKMAIVAQPMNGSPRRLDIKDFSTITDAENWTRATIDIPKELTKVNYINFTILGEATAVQPETPLFVDNIHFVDPLPADASVELITPKTINKGHKLDFKVKVTNLGKNTLDANTTVKVSVNGTATEQIALTKSLKTMSYELFPVSYQTNLTDPNTQLNVKAEIFANGDIESKNNVSETVIKFADANMPKPINLTSTGNNQARVNLSWEEPQIPTPTVTEDFESYEPWTTTMGEWTFIDADNGYNVSLDGSNFAFPHNREQFAFIAAKPSDYPHFKYKNYVPAHSGEKFAMSFMQVADLSKPIPINADNWMISPALPGKAQTISFWVKNTGTYAETFEVRYSKDVDPTNTQQFSKIGDTYTIDNGQWTEITVDLPEGTRFFAIRQNSSNKTTTMFMIDDITFMKGNTPISYNIYRDGILIDNTIDVTFNDQPNADGSHRYSVTAVYAGGTESAPIDVDVVTNIRSIETLGTSFYNVYTLDGVQVLKDAPNLNTLKPGIYIINGKKIIINK